MASEIRVNQIQNRSGLTTTTFTDTGVTISGILTVSENLNVGGVLTYEDVTNIDAIGIVTARSGLNVVGNDLNVGSNIKLGNASGIATATTFVGALTGTASGNPTLTSGANNRVVTATGANALTGESGLTYDGTTLSNDAVTRNIKSGANYVLIGSSNAGGVSLGLDGDSNGDGAGTDYAFFEHDTSGNLNIVGDNPANASNIIFKTNSTTERLRIKSDGNVTISNTTTSPSGDFRMLTLIARSDKQASIGFAQQSGVYSGATATAGYTVRLAGDAALELATHNSNITALKATQTGNVEMVGDLSTNNLSGRNIVINGDMRVAQRSTSESMSNAGNDIPVCDRWNYNRNGVTATVAQVAEAPAGRGFKYSLKWTSTSAVGSISAGNIVKFSYAIERQDIQRLGYGSSNAKKATLSFWAKGSIAGKIGVSCTRNSRITSHNVDMTANTWEFHEIVIPIDTSTALSGTDTDSGFSIGICWGGGSNSTSGATNNWIGFHNAYTAGFTAGQQGAYLTTSGSTFQITGVQFEVGSVSTPFEHRPISDELLRCQRYFKRMRGAVGGGSGYGSAGDGAVCTMANWTNTAAYGLLPLGVEMRYAPKLTGFANLNYFSAGNTWAPGSTSQCYLAGSSYDRVELTLQGLSSMSQGNAGWLRIDNTNGYMDFDAEL